MAQSAERSNIDNPEESSEWRLINLPDRVVVSILTMLDRLTDSSDFSILSDEENLKVYTGKTKPLVVRSIAQSTEPCLVIVAEPTSNVAFHKEMNTFDHNGTKPDYAGYGTLRVDIPSSHVFNATSSIWSNCKFPDMRS